MRTKINFLLLLLSSILFTNCQDAVDGDPGPKGEQGTQGAQGEAGVQPKLYEFGFALTSANNWISTYTFPENSPIQSNEFVLVYMMELVDTHETWKLMPIQYYNTDGSLSVDFEYTSTKLSVMANASYEMTSDNTYIGGKTARVVVIAGNVGAARFDYNDYENVKKVFNIPDQPIRLNH
jgi:hypothetical protein